MTAPKLIVSAGLLLSTIGCIPSQPQAVPEARVGHVRVTSLERDADSACEVPRPGAGARGDPAWERISLRQLYQERSP